jgi:hypothetical protein
MIRFASFASSASLLFVAHAVAVAQQPALATGTIAGLVTRDDGRPVSDGLVIVRDRPDTRTTADGHFVIRDVPVGLRQIEVRAIGSPPSFVTVDVRAGDTARVAVRLTRVTELDSMRTSATSFRTRLLSQYEQRKKAGWGTFRDSTTIAAKPSLTSVFADLPLPSIVVQEARGGSPIIYLPSRGGQGTNGCLAKLWIDGSPANQQDLARLRPVDLAAIEVYPRLEYAPIEFKDPRRQCGSVVVWTKDFLPP